MWSDAPKTRVPFNKVLLMDFSCVVLSLLCHVTCRRRSLDRERCQKKCVMVNSVVRRFFLEITIDLFFNRRLCDDVNTGHADRVNTGHADRVHTGHADRVHTGHDDYALSNERTFLHSWANASEYRRYVKKDQLRNIELSAWLLLYI